MERMSDYKKEFDLACEKIVKLEEENEKLKEIMCGILYRTTRHNIKNVVYKGEEIEIGSGDCNYNLD